MRTTTFRLALVYTFAFLLFTAILMTSLYVSTVGYLKSESNQLLEDELAYFLDRETKGLNYLAREVFERSGQPNRPFYYYLEDANGEKLAGIFPRLPAQTRAKITSVSFDVVLVDEVGNITSRAASGKIARIAGGSLLVAHDAQQLKVMVGRFSSSIFVFVFASIAMSIVGGVLVSRSAARRAELLGSTAESVIRGDLSQRVDINEPGDEFDRLGAHINTMLSQIEKLVAQARNSGNALAHDLRSPLTRLRNRLDRSLRQKHTAETAQEDIGAALEQTDDILRMFNAILSLSNIGSGMAGRFSRINVGDLVAELEELFEPSATEQGLDFETQTEQKLFIMGNKTLIAQALSNLIDNAIKYTPIGGKITLRAHKMGNKIVIRVTDTGPGVADEDTARIKERFVRLDSARTEQGSGLGLTLVEAVAEAHSGQFTLNDPKPEKGLLASLILNSAQN